MTFWLSDWWFDRSQYVRRSQPRACFSFASCKKNWIAGSDYVMKYNPSLTASMPFDWHRRVRLSYSRFPTGTYVPPCMRVLARCCLENLWNVGVLTIIQRFSKGFSQASAIQACAIQASTVEFLCAWSSPNLDVRWPQGLKIKSHRLLQVQTTFIYQNC